MEKILVCSLIFPIGLIPISAYSVNILPNPSFETWRDTAGVLVPDGWLTSELYNSHTAMRTEHAHTGNYAICLTHSPKEGVVGGVGILIDIVGGKEHALSLHYDCPRNSRGYVVIGEFSSNSLVEAIKRYLEPSDGYVLFDTSFVVHDSAVKLGISCNVSAEGDSTWMIYYDDIKLYQK